MKDLPLDLDCGDLEGDLEHSMMDVTETVDS